MSQVSQVINLFSNPEGPDGYLRQVVSYDNKLHEQDPTQAMATVCNVMAIKADEDILNRKDPESRLPTVRDIPWSEFPETLQEKFSEQLYLWGEDTRVAERLWHYEGDDVQPVIIVTDEGRQIAVQSTR